MVSRHKKLLCSIKREGGTFAAKDSRGLRFSSISIQISSCQISDFNSFPQEKCLVYEFAFFVMQLLSESDIRLKH